MCKLEFVSPFTIAMRYCTMHGLVEIKLYLELPEISPTSSTSQVSAATQKITIKFYFMHDLNYLENNAFIKHMIYVHT